MGHPITANEVKNYEADDISQYESEQQMEKSPSTYTVGCPPRKKFLKEFADGLKETFFADDPLKPYKDQPKSKKFMLGLQFLFPIFEWGRNYNLIKLKGDVIAGLTIASLCIPQVSLCNDLNCLVHIYLLYNINTIRRCQMFGLMTYLNKNLINDI